MVQIVGIAKAVTNLKEAHGKFNLSPISDRIIFRQEILTIGSSQWA